MTTYEYMYNGPLTCRKLKKKQRKVSAHVSYVANPLSRLLTEHGSPCLAK